MAIQAREVNLAAPGTNGPQGTLPQRPCSQPRQTMEDDVGKGILLWLVGVPIPVIILLFACHVIH